MTAPLIIVGQGRAAIAYTARGRRIIAGPPADTLTHAEVAAMLHQTNGVDTSATHRPLGHRPVAQRECATVGLWAWTLAWLGAGLIVGATLLGMAIRVGLVEVAR
jgi:hypothetical protein